MAETGLTAEGLDAYRREVDRLRAERDALKAAEKRVRSIADRWVAQAADNDRDELVPVLANVGRTILAALAAPESNEDAPTGEPVPFNPHWPPLGAPTGGED